MSSLSNVEALSLGNTYRPEHAWDFDSCCRCLFEWSHNQSQQAKRALARASARLDEIQRGWSFLHLWNLSVVVCRNIFDRQQIRYAKIAEESARLCLVGLSRPVVTAPPTAAPKPLAGIARADYQQATQPVQVPDGPRFILRSRLRHTEGFLESLNSRPSRRYSGVLQ